MSWCFNLICVILGYFVALLIYQGGLLLKRRVVPIRSTCSDVVISSPTSCWMPARFNRTVILVIDALRFNIYISVKDLSINSLLKHES